MTWGCYMFMQSLVGFQFSSTTGWPLFSEKKINRNDDADTDGEKERVWLWVICLQKLQSCCHFNYMKDILFFQAMSLLHSSVTFSTTERLLPCVDILFSILVIFWEKPVLTRQHFMHLISQTGNYMQKRNIFYQHDFNVFWFVPASYDQFDALLLLFLLIFCANTGRLLLAIQSAHFKCMVSILKGCFYSDFPVNGFHRMAINLKVT